MLIPLRKRTVLEKASEACLGLLGLAFSVLMAFLFLKLIWVVVMVL